jgi:outer membrane protein assembly factor BamB
VLFMSSAYQAGSRAIRLTSRGDATDTEELWFTNRVRFMFLSSIRIGDFVYGTTGDFGPAFLTALNIKTGESPWQVRGFARASLVAADGKVIVMNEDGDLALARLSPTGAEILARTKVFDTTTWTAPTLVGTTLYARDREKIVALDLGAKSGTASTAPAERPGARFSTFRAGSAPLPPTPADFAGSWRLDASASTVTTGAVSPACIRTARRCGCL